MSSDTDSKYVTEVTKRLEAFKRAVEWSDFISLLGSLETTIKKYGKDYIPCYSQLVKRLNQCLNPLLPAGVHLKTIETYTLIFNTLSRENLIKDFPIITIGLFQFSLNCRILVTAEYLDLLEKYIVPLGTNIKDHAKNVLLGLLPSLESESSEFFSRAYLIILSFYNSIDI